MVLAFFYYPSSLGCDETSEAIPPVVNNLSCNVTCEAGKYLDMEVDNKVSACKTCPANTYSVPGGLLIDGLMGDWSRIKQDIENSN